MAELARVARRRVVMLTWDPASPNFWLTNDYFPALTAIDRPIFPTLEELARTFRQLENRPLPIPHDCTDGFLGAYWRRPDAYLDAGVRGAMSTFTKLNSLEPGLTRLRNDLENGSWERRHGHLLAASELDLGYRIVIARTDSRE